MAAKKKLTRAKSLTGILLFLALALAKSLGWIDLGDSEPGSARDPSGHSAASEARTPTGGATTSEQGEPTDDETAAEIAQLFKAKRSDVQVHGSGIVRVVLADDDVAPRHQKFILELSNGMTLLVAHNIDLAPRLPLRKGDSVSFNGEYEYSDQGGVLHWTHRDPGNRHEDGWLELSGERFQ